jgi:phosphoglycolate phosphatase-like HAD superfamily hydrolase
MRNDTQRHDARGSLCLVSPASLLSLDRDTRPRSTAIEAVFFDLCGVLYDDTIWRRWLFQLLSRMGLHTHYTLFFRLWDREYQDDVLWGRLSYWDALRRFLLSAGLSRGQVDEVEAAGRARLREFEQDLRPFPQVRSAVAHLAARGIRLGIACAAPFTADALAAKLERLRLRPWFPTVLSAQDLPPGATRRERFQAVVNIAETPAAHIAYVGRIGEELRAAAHVGLLTIAFNQETDAIADMYLDQFDQLPHLLLSSAPPLRAAG